MSSHIKYSIYRSIYVVIFTDLLHTGSYWLDFVFVCIEQNKKRLSYTWMPVQIPEAATKSFENGTQD